MTIVVVDMSRDGVNLQLGATYWIFSGFHLPGTILYVSRKLSTFCFDQCCNPIVLLGPAMFLLYHSVGCNIHG